MKQLISVLLVCLLLAGCGGAPAPVETAAPTTQSTEATVPVTTEAEPEAPARVLPDGVYTVDFETDSSMFRANEACNGKGTLTVTGGVQTLHVSLQSKKIVNLYPGTAEDAQNPGAVWLEPSVDTVTYSYGLSDEVFGFDVPVASVGQDFALAIIGTKGVWYDHTVSVRNPVPQAGEYTCDVALSGGSGRAGVTTPTKLVSDGETLTATIQWSSPYYEYMIVDGTRYEPIQTEGNSTFEIPVTLDAELAVSASTVAMSQPHLVDYTLTFDSVSLCAK